MDLDSLTQQSGDWLRGTGPESDVVVSSRIRLARNISEFPFNTRTDEDTRERIVEQVRGALDDLAAPSVLHYIDVSDLNDTDRQFLVERQLISRELAESDGARSVAIDNREQFSLMVNEEDHLRLQVLASGLDLQNCWERIDRLDDALEESLLGFGGRVALADEIENHLPEP